MATSRARPARAAGGAIPNAGLVRHADGYFHGTTGYGGHYGKGTVFRMSTAGAVRVLHDFECPEQNYRLPGQLVVDDADALWGPTLFGGKRLGGSIFRMTRKAR